MTSDYSQSFVKVDHIDISHTVATDRASKGILHASIIGHLIGYCGTHEKLDSQELGFLAKAMLGRMQGEQPLPLKDVSGIVVGLDAASCEPDGMSVFDSRVGKAVTVGGHDTLDRTVNILVGGVGEGSHRGLDGEGCNDMVGTKDSLATLHFLTKALWNSLQHGLALFNTDNLNRVEVALKTADDVCGGEHIEGHTAQGVHGVAVVVLSEATKVGWLGKCEPHTIDGVPSGQVWSGVQVLLREVVEQGVKRGLEFGRVNITLSNGKRVQNAISR